MAELSESSSKRRREDENAKTIDIDRISGLPDSVLLHILAFLPTESSVRTSILSSRWSHLWKHLQVLEFVDCSSETKRFRAFALFVYGVLARRKARDIRKFRLWTLCKLDKSFDEISVLTWIRTAIGPYLEELELLLSFADSFILPTSLYTCSSLVSLTLRGGIRVVPPATVHLPSLQSLTLMVDYVKSLDTLLAGCPALRFLELCLGGIGSSKIYVPSLQNVVEAYLDFFELDDKIDDVIELLRGLCRLCRVKFMTLGSKTIERLFWNPSLDFPELHYLVRLELILPWFSSNFLMNLLQKCNILQNLVIKEVKARSLSQWTQPTNVPNCLVWHLSTIKFIGYQGFADEYAFCGYILRMGLVLKTMIVCADRLCSLEKKHEIVKELCAIPRGSNMCQLTFD